MRVAWKDLEKQQQKLTRNVCLFKYVVMEILLVKIANSVKKASNFLLSNLD